MKLITFAIPCYNSQDYMNKCLDSLLKAQEDIEIIIIDDGSKDKTGKIADEYQKKFPDIIKVIHKENGGHGSGVNAGLSAAQGLYFKVIDSDDWVNEEALKKVIKTLKELKNNQTLVDMFVVNYVYEKEGEKPKAVKYTKTLPENEVFGWDKVGKFNKSAYLLMHSVIYNTKFLKKTNLKLPEHTFYVDNIYVYYPLPQVKTMYYLNVDFYRYYIGRVDQSVNEKVMISRVNQQLKITKMMIDFYNPYDLWAQNKNCAKYLIHYIDIMMSVSTILLQLENTKESKQKKEDLWNYLKEVNPRLYKICRLSVSGLSDLPRFISIPGYKVARKIYKFN